LGSPGVFEGPDPGGLDVIRNIERLHIANTVYDIVMDTTATGSTITGGNGSQAIFGLAGNDTLNGQGASDILVGGEGNDLINGGNGDDWIFQVGATDGHDIINGGAGVDTYTLSGVNGQAETFNIYARAAAISAGFGTGLNANTEIVITRNGTVIAELNDVEEIRVNSLLTTQQDGNGVVNSGSADGDTVAVFGNFAAPFTSLLYNTIRINGTDANDTVDISGLQSDHRIVFTTNGGADTVLGTVREQDTIAGAVTDLRGAAPADFGVQDGLDAMVGGEVTAASLLGGSGDSEMSIGRTMIEMDQIFPLDTVETGPVEPVFVNDAPVELTERQVITDYLVS
jgi:Ca2+-binding RTX toxin-like protein